MVPEMLFIVMLFIEFLFLVFLVAIFNTPLNKAFNSNPILNLWNVLHATLLYSVVSPTTPETKNIQPESE